MVRSWGYDQTNVDFYEVVAVKGATATIRKIGATHTFIGSDRLIAVRGRFIGPEKKCRIGKGYDGKLSLCVSDGDHAYAWDGKPMYATPSGYGH